MSVASLPVIRKFTRRSLAQDEEIHFYLFITPWLIGFVLFTLGPILASLALSFTRYNIVKPPVFTWLENYKLLANDSLFWQSLKVTAGYVLFAVPLGIAGSLLLAIVLNQKIRGVSVFRTVFYLPNVISGVAVGLLWMWVLNPDFGVLNYLLYVLFKIHGPPWLFSETWVMPSFILMSLWNIGGPMLIYLAALQGIPTHLYEAAELDGAGMGARFRHVTLPMITPVILFTMITSVIGSFQVFTQAYVMTKGGPGYSSLFYGLYLYQNAFFFFKMGYAAALAWILFMIILVCTVLLFKTSDRWVFYEGGTEGGI
jgi:multiple sugar transport system permease protein